MFDLKHCDCLDFMRNLDSKSVDLIITDPPYGKNADRGTNGFGSSKNRRYSGGWDSRIPEKIYFDEMFRVAKNLIIFGGNYFASLLPTSKCWIYWDKKGDVAFQNPFADGELIYTTFTHPIKRIVFKQQGFISDSKDKRYHPTQKPSELVQMLVERYSEEGETIFDPFTGSGTTGIACLRTNRNFIGCELNEDYFNVALNRLANLENRKVVDP